MIILLDRLKKLLLVVPEDSWDKEYWADIYYSMLQYFFENVRDITRYVNTLSFGFSWVKARQGERQAQPVVGAFRYFLKRQL